MEDFGDNDQIYEEFCSTSESLDDELPLHKKASFNWRKNWPKIFPWLVICSLHTFSVVFLCSFLVDMLITIIMFIEINTANACYKTKSHPCHEADLLFFHWSRLKILSIGYQIVVFINIISINSWLQSVKKIPETFAQIPNF